MQIISKCCPCNIYGFLEFSRSVLEPKQFSRKLVRAQMGCWLCFLYTFTFIPTFKYSMLRPVPKRIRFFGEVDTRNHSWYKELVSFGPPFEFYDIVRRD